MSIFLDQDEIDRLQHELIELGAKKEKAQDAKDKIKEIYFSAVKEHLISPLSTLQEIGIAVNRIHISISKESKYWDSFCMLKDSYDKRTRRY